MIELTFTGKSLAEVKEGIASFLGEEPKKVVQKTAEVKKEVQKDEIPDQVEKVVTLDEIKTLTKAKMEEKKTKAIKALLADFDATKVDRLKKEDYVAFYEGLERL